MNKDDKYKEDGVDIEAGDVFSKYCNEINKSTYEFSPYVKITDFSRGNFRGPKGFTFQNLPNDYVNTAAVDGIGTKVVIIAASGKTITSASNVIAMTAMDITRWGGLPLLFMNILDVRSLGEIDSETFANYKEMMDGLRDIAYEHKYVLFTGETAELGLCIGSENQEAKMMFNWGGAMLGVYHPDKMILGDTLAPGQVVIALRDDFRSNGIGSVRKALALRYGSDWWDNPEAAKDIIACASPSAQYDRLINTAHGWFEKNPMQPLSEMHLVVHLSGGAFESKLGNDMLKPLNLSADLDDLFEPPEIMKECAKWRGMNPQECYKTWNGGQGAIVVVNEEEAESFLCLANGFNIEAKVAGVITKGKNYTVRIESKFGDGKLLKYL